MGDRKQPTPLPASQRRPDPPPAPPRKVFASNSECEHGVALDVHCCNCHSGFLFDVKSCTCGITVDEVPQDGEQLIWNAMKRYCEANPCTSIAVTTPRGRWTLTFTPVEKSGTVVYSSEGKKE